MFVEKSFADVTQTLRMFNGIIYTFTIAKKWNKKMLHWIIMLLVNGIEKGPIIKWPESCIDE